MSSLSCIKLRRLSQNHCRKLVHVKAGIEVAPMLVKKMNNTHHVSICIAHSPCVQWAYDSGCTASQVKFDPVLPKCPYAAVC